MGKRGEPTALTGEEIRQKMLQGIKDPAAVFLYDQAMMALESAGRADFMAALQLREACQWTQLISDLSRRIGVLTMDCGENNKSISASIKHKQAAEDARRRIMDGLLLTPQKKRGRPPEERPERESDDTAALDDAWDAFDAGGDDRGDVP